MDEIQVGSAVITLVDPHLGREEIYNRWYERDHYFAAVLLGPQALSGGRFVARRHEKMERRVSAGIGTSDTGTLLSVYWLLGDGEDHRKWSQENIPLLRAAGRMSKDRDLVWGFRCRLAWSLERDPDGVPTLLALEHRFGAVGTLMVEATEAISSEEMAENLRESIREELLGPESPVGICVALLPESVPDPMGITETSWFSQKCARILFLWFLDTESADWSLLFDKHESVLALSGISRPMWASPFTPTIVGTNIHMNDLWLTHEERT